METEVLASRNIVDNLFDIHFGAGLCPPDAELIFSESDVAQSGGVEQKGEGGWGGTGAEGRIFGWDC
jgi:hypothetical protein